MSAPRQKADHTCRTDRRQVLAGALGASALVVSGATTAREVLREASSLRPGEFVWHPERSPSGPVAVIVSIPDQRVHVYRNGIRIGVSTCSTGREGHRTPTGVFTILQKDRNHRSSTYNNAPMPNMNRLTWSGIALHAGQLPGYPASHGCVRLPLAFSRLLFSVTHIGTPVIIASDHSDPARVAHPGLVLPSAAETRMEQAVAALSVRARPNQTHEDNPVPPLSILVSGADRRILVFENGDIVAEGRAIIQQPSIGLGSHVYVLAEASGGQTFWHGIGHRSDPRADALDAATLHRIGAETPVQQEIQRRLHVGAVLTTVDLPLTADSRSGKDFVVVSDDTPV